jgi:uroporphyrinogen-III decarboxylase
MTRKERLMATLRGETVDRPPVCFYELDGITQNPANPDPYNIFNDPSWLPLLRLTAEKTDRIVLTSVGFLNAPPDPAEAFTKREVFTNEKGDLCTNTTIQAGSRVLTERTAREKNVDTVWTLEHLIKDVEDFKEWIELPQAEFGGEVDVNSVLEIEKTLGDSGIVCLDMSDPLCVIASLFDLGEYTITALTEPELFHRALRKVSELMLKRTEAIAAALPGRLWRIYGPEYACPPYLPPRLFNEYVVQYVTPIIEIIKRYGGYPRIHAHGNMKDVLGAIVSTGCIGLDPLEPPNQGNVTLKYVRETCGEDFVLFGNLELSDIEIMNSDEFEQKIITALEEGPSKSGNGFVLMPSACPIGRELKTTTLENYKKIIEVVERIYR